MTEFFQVTTATDTREAAVTLARSVIEARLAAACSISAASVYESGSQLK
jgi:uncharacterized protein involved in tolerance to divalent cations